MSDGGVFDEAWYQRHMAKFQQAAPVPDVLSNVSTPKRQKFNAQPSVVQGRTFRSKKEGQRYFELLMRLKAGEIRKLECQPEFVMHTENAAGEWIACGKYKADFRYLVLSKAKPGDILPECWAEVVEDVKGGPATRTEAYRLRKRKVEAEYGITIVEV